MWPGQTRFESCWWHFFFCSFFNILVCKALLIASRAQFPRNRAKLTSKSEKISPLSVLMQRPCRGPLRHVCGHINHRTTLVHTFLKSLSHLDVYPGKRFALFGQNRRNWRREVGTQKNEICGRYIYPTAMFSTFLHPFTCCWHTGDNVRLSDVVKLNVAK